MSDELMGWKALVAIKEARIAQLEAGLQLALRRLEVHEDAPLNSDLRQLFASTSETICECGSTCDHTFEAMASSPGRICTKCGHAVLAR